MYIRYNRVKIYSHFKTLSFFYSDVIFTKDTKHWNTHKPFSLSLSLFTLQKFPNRTLKTKNYITAPLKTTLFFQDVYIFSTKIYTQHDHIINHFLNLFKFLFTLNFSVIYLHLSLVSAFLGLLCKSRNAAASVPVKAVESNDSNRRIVPEVSTHPNTSTTVPWRRRRWWLGCSWSGRRRSHHEKLVPKE